MTWLPRSVRVSMASCQKRYHAAVTLRIGDELIEHVHLRNSRRIARYSSSLPRRLRITSALTTENTPLLSHRVARSGKEESPDTAARRTRIQHAPIEVRGRIDQFIQTHCFITHNDIIGVQEHQIDITESMTCQIRQKVELSPRRTSTVRAARWPSQGRSRYERLCSPESQTGKRPECRHLAQRRHAVG